MKRIITTSLTMAVGIATLLTFLMSGVFPWLAGLRYALVEWAIVVAAFAMLLGFVNVFHVHATRIARGRRSDGFFSFVALVCLVGVAVASFGDAGLSLFNQPSPQDMAQRGIAGGLITRLFDYVLIPIQSSLAALLPFLLAFAAYRTFRVRSASGKAGALVFLITAIIVLVGQVPLFNAPFLRETREWIMRVWAMAGMRGILLGVALGIMATALRVLIGADRPTSD